MTNNNNIVEEVQGAEATSEGKVNMMFPTELLKKLEVLFADDKIDFNKVLFTVYWINKGKYNSLKGKNESYQEVSSRYGNWISLIGKKGADFIKKLVDGGIIKKVSGYVTAKHYTRYTLVNPFNYKGGDATGDIWTIYTLYPEDGAFIKKYLSDKHVVRIKTNTTKANTIAKPKVEDSLKVEQGEAIDITAEINKINMTLNELINKVTALENENKELREQLNNKADIASALKKEMAQHVNTAVNKRFEEPISDVNPDEVATDIIYDSIQDDKANTPFFSDDDDIDFGEDLIKRVEALIMPEDDIDFSKVFISDDTSIEQPKVDINSLQSPIEKKLNTIIKRHIKPVAQIKMLSKFILANQEQEITAAMILNVGVGMSGATANRILNDLKLINFN